MEEGRGRECVKENNEKRDNILNAANVKKRLELFQLCDKKKYTKMSQKSYLFILITKDTMLLNKKKKLLLLIVGYCCSYRK
jgi:hypothetical protein